MIINCSITSLSMSNCHASTGNGVPGRNPQMVSGDYCNHRFSLIQEYHR